MKDSFLSFGSGNIWDLKILKYLILVIIIIFLCLQCERKDKSETDDGNDTSGDKTDNSSSKVRVAVILNGFWETRFIVSYYSNSSWYDLDSTLVENHYRTYRYWQIDTTGKVINQADGCDFNPSIQTKWNTTSDGNKELTIDNTSYKVIKWNSDTCIIQSSGSSSNRFTYYLARMKGNYSTTDYRDRYTGEYKGTKKSWVGFGGSYNYTYIYDYVITVTKLTCSPDQIKVNPGGVYRLKSNLQYGYSHLPDADYLNGKFSNDTILEISTKVHDNDVGSYYYGVKKH
jgi:hypothetical protein